MSVFSQVVAKGVTGDSDHLLPVLSDVVTIGHSQAETAMVGGDAVEDLVAGWRSHWRKVEQL